MEIKMTKNEFCIFRYHSLPKTFPLILAVGSHRNQLVEIVTAYHCRLLSSCQLIQWLCDDSRVTLTTTWFLWWVDSHVYLDSQDNEIMERWNGILECVTQYKHFSYLMSIVELSTDNNARGSSGIICLRLQNMRGPILSVEVVWYIWLQVV